MSRLSVLAKASFCALPALLLMGCAGNARPSSRLPSEAPSLSISVKSLHFSSVVVGQTQSQTLNISNSGNAPLRLVSLSASIPQFSVTGPPLPATITPSLSLPYTVTYSPTSTGNDSGTLEVTSNASNGIVALPLSGVGQKAFADLAVTPSSVNFGSLNLKVKGTQKVTLQNTGDVSMTIQGVTLAGAGFGYASLSPGSSLSPSQSVTFEVWFTPQVKGSASATMSFLSPSLSSPATLSLSGDGIVGSSPPTESPAPEPKPAGRHKVQLSWGASQSGVLGYRVYRSETSGASYTLLIDAPFNALTYTDKTVVSGTTYYYVVTSVDAAGGESAYSNQVKAVVPTP
jgi:hypothetical protein